jgi:ABC-type glycerol-3-phosphate transport system permease component
VSTGKRIAIHVVLIGFALLTLLPFAFMMNNVFRTNTEFYHSFFSLPQAVRELSALGVDALRGRTGEVEIKDAEGETVLVSRGEAAAHWWDQATRGIRRAWVVVRPYMLNSFVVSLTTALGVALIGSATAYIRARYRFLGSRAVFLIIISTMMFPGVLTLVPSFLLVKKMGLLNTYWAMILPYIAGGQVFAIFVFKSFFEGLDEDLFESARIDGAGHFGIYWHLVLPLSKPAFSVVLVMNLLGTWNNFLWPFITNTEGKRHVLASGLYSLARSPLASNFSTVYAAYAVSSIPLLVLFIYATKPFIQGMSSGALKA